MYGAVRKLASIFFCTLFSLDLGIYLYIYFLHLLSGGRLGDLFTKNYPRNSLVTWGVGTWYMHKVVSFTVHIATILA